jgi:hypothetical protein
VLCGVIDKLFIITDGRLTGTHVVNSQQTDSCEANISVAEHDGCSDSDDTSVDSNTQDEIQGLYVVVIVE